MSLLDSDEASVIMILYHIVYAIAYSKLATSEVLTIVLKELKESHLTNGPDVQDVYDAFTVFITKMLKEN